MAKSHDVPRFGNVPQPLDTRILVGPVRLPGAHVDLTRNGLVDNGLLLLLQQRDQLLLGADVAPDAPVGVVEEAHDGGLFWQRRESDGHSTHELPISARHLRPECRAVDCINDRF